MFTVFLFYKEKELLTGEGCVEMDVPWQLCRTIGPLTLHSQEIKKRSTACAHAVKIPQITDIDKDLGNGQIFGTCVLEVQLFKQGRKDKQMDRQTATTNYIMSLLCGR